MSVAISAWLIIGLAAVAMWPLWGFVSLIFDLIEYWYAAHQREAQQSDKEKGSFSLWPS